MHTTPTHTDREGLKLSTTTEFIFSLSMCIYDEKGQVVSKYDKFVGEKKVRVGGLLISLPAKIKTILRARSSKLCTLLHNYACLQITVYSKIGMNF